jgi:hypothetical protein
MQNYFAVLGGDDRAGEKKDSHVGYSEIIKPSETKIDEKELVEFTTVVRRKQRSSKNVEVIAPVISFQNYFGPRFYVPKVLFI